MRGRRRPHAGPRHRGGALFCERPLDPPMQQENRDLALFLLGCATVVVLVVMLFLFAGSGII